MRIDGNRPNSETAAAQAQKAAKPTVEAARTGTAGKAGAGDRIALSADAALAHAAAKAAAEAPEVRTDVVEKMRGLMLSGELGTDVEGLADSLIDAMLESR